jgi:putative zinc finger protein
MNCLEIRQQLPGYLDGASRSREHARVREHLDLCEDCREELQRYRRLSVSLGQLEPVAPPPDLAAKIRVHVYQERAARKRSRTFFARARLVFEDILQPLAVPATGGVLAAVLVFVLVGQNVMGGIPFGAVPNDLPTSLFQPARLESMAPFSVPGISVNSDRPGGGVLMIEATLDAQGEVVGYEILSGPDNAAVRHQLDQVLLFSRFRPQLDFGRPIAGGRVMLLFSEVSVKG